MTRAQLPSELVQPLPRPDAMGTSANDNASVAVFGQRLKSSSQSSRLQWPNDQLSSGRRWGKPGTPETNERRQSAAAFGYPALARHLSLTLRLPRSAKTEHEDR
jgi:hypothetical protein